MGSGGTARPRAEVVVDVLGAGVLAALMATTLLASRGDRSNVLELLGACTAAVVVGRVVGPVHRAIPAIVVVAVGLWVWADSGAALVGTGTLGHPFAAENATAAFLAQAAFAGAIVAAATRRVAVVAVAALAAIGSGSAAVRASTAAAPSLGLMLVAVPALLRPRWARPAVLVAGGLFLAVLTSTVVLGATYRAGDQAHGLEGALRSALTERRVALWHDALGILAERPAGVGPGRFAKVPPRFLSDQDVSWAYNEFLQQGTELGWAGLIFTVLLFLWGFARLLVHPAPDVVVALGAASLAALAIHASVEPVLHFPAVPIAAAVLVGAAQAVPRVGSSDEAAEPGGGGVGEGANPAGATGSNHR